MGAVFLVEHIHTGDRAALKVLHGAASIDPESIERFKREARAPARIQSENVVRVLDADTAPELGGAPFLVMELLSGNDLQKLVAKQGPLSFAEAARILGQVARALDKAHAMGIVHRDLKPENLFLHQREDGTSVVKILDFGISKTMDDVMATGVGQLTRTGAVMGTPLYMALEQALGRRDMVGPGTDIWALGLIAIYLLTGEPYWQGRTVPDILGKVLGNAMYAPSTRWPLLPPALDAWILRSCARLPEQRFRTAGEQVAELTEILRHADSAAVANAATMLPSQAWPPSTPMHVTPPHVTPPQITPVQLATPPPFTPSPYTPAPYTPAPYAPHAVGGSTNEPLMHTARGATAEGGGMSLGAKVAIIIIGLFFVMGGGAIAAFAFVLPRFTEATPAATVSPPTTNTGVTPPTTVTPEPSAIEPLAIGAQTGTTVKPHPSATAQVTVAPTVTTAPTATATTHVGPTRVECRNRCNAACVDANDMNDCLVKCLKRCPSQ